MRNLHYRYALLSAGLLLLGLPSHAQFGWAFYGGRYGTATNDTNRGIINQINSSSGAETTAVNLLNFSTFTGLTFQGTNALAYDRTSDRIYFALSSGTGADGRGTLTQGDMGVYWWSRSSNTVGSLISFTGQTTPDVNSGGNNINRQINADNAFVYNGYYYFTQDQAVDSTPELFRVSLTATTPTIERLQDFNGTNTRNYYDFGDMAVSAGGVMYGSAGDGRTNPRNNWWFSSNISASTPGAMSSTGYTETTPSTTQQLYQLGFGWQGDGSTLSGTLYGQNSNGSSGGTGAFSTINTTTGAPGTTLFTGARIYSDLTTAPLLVPEPPTLSLLGLGAIGLLLLRRRRVCAVCARQR